MRGASSHRENASKQKAQGPLPEGQRSNLRPICVCLPNRVHKIEGSEL